MAKRLVLFSVLLLVLISATSAMACGGAYPCTASTSAVGGPGPGK